MIVVVFDQLPPSLIVQINLITYSLHVHSAVSSLVDGTTLLTLLSPLSASADGSRA